MVDIVLIYAQEDIKKGEILAEALRNQGLTVARTVASPVQKPELEAVIEQTIREADCLLIAWSDATKQSVWVRRKAGLGSERNILVSILFEEVDPPTVFSTLPTLNMAQWEGDVKAAEFLALCKTIKEGSNQQSTVKAGNLFFQKLFDSINHFFTKKPKDKEQPAKSIPLKPAFLVGLMALVATGAGGWQVLHDDAGNPAIKSSALITSDTRINESPSVIPKNPLLATDEVDNSATTPEIRALADKIVSKLTKLNTSLQPNAAEIKALAESVSALSNGQGVIGSDFQIKTSLDALMQGDTSQAKALFSIAAQNTSLGPDDTAKAYRNLGAIAYFDNTQEALSAYRRATELEAGNADSWRKLAVLLVRLGQTEGAIAAFNKALPISEALNDNGAVAETYTQLGSAYQAIGKLDKAMNYDLKALALNESTANKEGIINDYSNLGSVYQSLGDLEKALTFHQKALALNNEAHIKTGLPTIYTNLGNVFQARGELDNAAEHFLKALALDESNGNKVGMAAAYGNLGIVYKTQGNLEKAIQFHQKALTLNQRLGRKEGMANAYTNLGNVYQAQNELEMALEYYQKALALYEGLRKNEGMAANYTNLGLVYETRGQFEKAEGYYQKALELDQSLGNKEGMAADYSNLGLVYQQQTRKEKAKQAYQNSIALYKTLGFSSKASKWQSLLDAL